MMRFAVCTAAIFQLPPEVKVIRTQIRIAIAAVLTVVAAGTAACGGGDGVPVPTVKGGSAPVTVALDWTPNTNHIGAFVAQQKGWYRDAGLDVRFLPYASTPPETLVSTGKADFGWSYAAGVAYARAAGEDVVMVMAPIAKPQYAIGVRADRKDISSPRDLDGRVYAGFGLPDEKPTLDFVIRKAGGKGNYRTITLNTTAYQAVYSGSADFTLPSKTWEGVEAALRGKPFRFFEYSDYGFPAAYSTGLISSDAFLNAHPDRARAFLAATLKGYFFARSHPLDAARLLVAANPQALKDSRLVEQSASLLAADGYYGNGRSDAKVWQRYGDFLFTNGKLVGPDGKPLKASPNWSAFWTNAYLPKG